MWAAVLCLDEFVGTWIVDEKVKKERGEDVRYEHYDEPEADQEEVLSVSGGVLDQLILRQGADVG